MTAPAIFDYSGPLVGRQWPRECRAPTRSSSSRAGAGMSTVEKVSMLLLAIACLLNGLTLALNTRRLNRQTNRVRLVVRDELTDTFKRVARSARGPVR